MTIGEKIKYLRTQMDITQGALADLAGVHPVTVRKYETNKMHPQPAQISKLADALRVSANALIGAENTSFRLETYGDLMGIFIILYNSNIISVDGTRGEDGLITDESLELRFNPLLKKIIKTTVKEGNKNMSFEMDALLFQVKSPFILPNVQKWEYINYLCNTAHCDMGENPNQATLDMVAELDNRKELIALELQRSMILLKAE